MLLQKEEIQQIVQHVPKRQDIVPAYTPSAILMLFFNRDRETHLVYIRRTKGAPVHSGSMAFPGGKIDPHDDSNFAAAARETSEEIGVDQTAYEHLGEMGFFETFTSKFDAAAHVAWCMAPPSYVCNTFEVAEIIEIPISELYKQFRLDLNFDDPNEVMYLGFHFQPSHSEAVNIWGLTARITHHFLQGLADFMSS